MIIDLHTHILPGIDDGSKNSAMSIEMLQQQKAQGVDLLVLTPHFYEDRVDIDTFLRRRNEAFAHLRQRIKEAEAAGDIAAKEAAATQEAAPDFPTSVRPHNLGPAYPQVLLASETAFFSGISEELRIRELCIEGTNTLLLEMPFTEWTNRQLEEVETLVLARGLNVILAHPERFLYSKSNEAMLYQLMQLPVGIQVNAEPLLHFLPRKKSLQLLAAAEWPMLGSDCHNLTERIPNLAKGREVIRKKLGEDFLASMDDQTLKLL